MYAVFAVVAGVVLAATDVFLPFHHFQDIRRKL